ncbi:MAG: V-type ATP synthase subunit D [Candidatus Omnitrophica bacterium]|nr:V-type ATP synthase subunit D [Candidatus Omnitrophota bacterium]
MSSLAATKANLIKAKKNLELTREGYELLEEKRRILLNELAGLANLVAKAEEDVEQAIAKAYAVVDQAMMEMGREKLEELSFAVGIKPELSFSSRQVVGVTLPAVHLEMVDHPPYFSPHQVSLYVDEAILRFKELLKLLAGLAEKKIALVRLALEARRTIHKVRAIEKVHLPALEKTIKFISERLDEENREAFSNQKWLKEKKFL